MSLTLYKDNQELFQGCQLYYDGSIIPATGTVLNVMDSANNGLVVGALSKNANNRFGQPYATATPKYGAFSTFAIDAYVTQPLYLNYANGTIAMWVYANLSGNGTDRTPYYIYQTTGTVRKLGFSIGTNNKWWAETYNGSTNPSVSSNNTQPTNQWTLIAFTWGSAYQHFYIFTMDQLYDHASNTDSGGMTSLINGGSIGVYDYVSGKASPWNGAIQEVFIYNKQLTQLELTNLWKATKLGYLYPIIAGTKGVY